MTTSRKLLIVLGAVILGYAGFFTVEQRNAASQASSVRASLAVGDPGDKVERVMRERSLEPRYESDGAWRGYFATISLHERLYILMIVHMDDAKRVTAIEVRSRTWIDVFSRDPLFRKIALVGSGLWVVASFFPLALKRARQRRSEKKLNK